MRKSKQALFLHNRLQSMVQMLMPLHRIQQSLVRISATLTEIVEHSLKIRRELQQFLSRVTVSLGYSSIDPLLYVAGIISTKECI
jgi:hypothetical protein